MKKPVEVAEVTTLTPDSMRESYHEEVVKWNHADLDRCMTSVHQVQDLLLQNGGGIIVVIAPTDNLEKITGHTADSGYMDAKLGCDVGSTSVHDNLFITELQAARRHKEGDRDEQGQCCDGAFLISAAGVVRRSRVKCKYPSPDIVWPKHGTRHEAAIGIARSLECAVVWVASEAGSLHVITAKGASEGLVYELKANAMSDHEAVAK